MSRPHPSRWGMGIGNLVMGWNYSLYAPIAHGVWGIGFTQDTIGENNNL